MIHPKDSARIRADALRVGAEKQLGGCLKCAEGYFALARQHGANEEDILGALTGARREAERLALGRRELLKLAAASAIGVATASITWGAGPGFAMAAADPAAGDGAQVAWVQALRTPLPAKGEPETRLLGIGPNGSFVGQIEPLRGQPLRSPDGTELVVTWSRKDAAGATAIVEVYSAATGALERQIIGQTVVLNSATDFDGLRPAMSADGRLLAVLHQTRRLKPGTVRQIQKGGSYGIPTIPLTVGEAAITDALELIDLQAGHTLAYQELGTADSNRGGGSVLFTPDGQQLYVSTVDQAGNMSVTAVAVAGGRLQVQGRATNGQNGHRLPASGLTARPAMRIQGSATLVRYDLPNHVRFFDLGALTLQKEVDIDLDRSTKPAFPVGLFASGDAMLYVANADTGTVQAVNLVQGTLAGTTTVPAGTPMPGVHPRRGGGPGTAALAPDGTRLFLVDDRTGAGLAILQLPSLQLVGHWLPDQGVRAVWPTPDGQTIFALGPDGMVYLLHSDGSVAGALSVGSEALAFVTAG